MLKKIIFYSVLYLFLSFNLALTGERIFEGTGYINYAGYTDCIFLENKNVRVILDPHTGGGSLSILYVG